MSAQTMDKSRPSSTLSGNASRPSLKISIPSRSFTSEETYKDDIAAMGSLLHENISPKDGTLSLNIAFSIANNVDMAGASSTKNSQIPVVGFSESCNSPPMEFTVPTSPAPHAGDWYDSDQSEETSPNRSDTFDNTIDSLLDSYLCQDSNAAHYSPSNYSPCDETNGEVSDHWDNSFPGRYGVEDFLECLYDSYSDEDMTLETGRINECKM